VTQLPCSVGSHDLGVESGQESNVSWPVDRSTVWMRRWAVLEHIAQLRTTQRAAEDSGQFCGFPRTFHLVWVSDNRSDVTLPSVGQRLVASLLHLHPLHDVVLWDLTTLVGPDPVLLLQSYVGEVAFHRECECAFAYAEQRRHVRPSPSPSCTDSTMTCSRAQDGGLEYPEDSRSPVLRAVLDKLSPYCQSTVDHWALYATPEACHTAVTPAVLADAIRLEALVTHGGIYVSLNLRVTSRLDVLGCDTSRYLGQLPHSVTGLTEAPAQLASRPAANDTSQLDDTDLVLCSEDSNVHAYVSDHFMMSKPNSSMLQVRLGQTSQGCVCCLTVAPDSPVS
jgi:hypothetical protein